MSKEKNLDTAFFGQPRGLSTLFFTEMWERFSYYGMRSILLFYMYYAVTKGGLGMDQATAASIMAIYGSLVYLSSVVGGWLSDRVWGSRKTVFIGGVLIMFGHIALSLPAGVTALYVSIALIVIGTGLLKPNVSEMVGGLYSPDDERRDSGFSMFVFGINLGAAVAPWAVPWAANGFGFHLFGNEMNFHAGFSLAAIGMFFGLLQYTLDGRKYLSKDSLYPNDPIEKDDLRPIIIWTLVGVAVLVVVLGLLAAMGQLALFAEQRTVLHIGSWHFAAANFQTLNPLFIMILTPVFVALWDHWKGQPSAPGKFSAGLVFAGLSYILMAFPGMMYGTAGRVSPFWLVGSWFIVEIGEMLISPIGLSVTTKLAPKAFKSQMMSMWFLADSAGQAVNAQIVKYYSSATEVPYFMIVGIVSIVFGIILMFFVKKIHSLMDGVN